MGKKRKRTRAPIIFTENTKSNAIIGPSRVSNVAKAYNVSTHTLLDYLYIKGFKELTQNSKLNLVALDLVGKEFSKDKATKDIVRGPTNLHFETKGKNKEAKSGQPVLYLEKNLFTYIKKEIFLNNLPPIDSYFSNAEAINLCKKMCSSYTRNLCKQLNNSKGSDELILYQIHFIANKALKLYGGKMLTFIHDLRSINFKKQTANEIRTYSKVIPDFPILTFETSNDSYKISFFHTQISSNYHKPDVRLYYSKTNDLIGTIDEDGYILARLEKFRPHLNLFYEAIRDRNFKVYAGVETGKCEICGRELTDPTSLRIGLGPVCAKNQNIDTDIYKFN